MNHQDIQFLREAIRLAHEGPAQQAGGPFGAVVVKNGEIVGSSFNRVPSTNDPTAHAEVMAIRDACARLGTFQLDGCILYASCEPCPMCLGAIYWARPDRVVYAATQSDAAAIGFDDQFIYEQIELPPAQRSIPMTQLLRDEALGAFVAWTHIENKTEY
ncbi:MAG TPA: nucleoside deaminase [Saprospiraceae bacterium]|nr:nucleoside deaminase [Saprospiraceae bacterium]HRJ15238.1 nucleoside deaminase [Saprospiraceae bacterium]HRK81858.1 nucleoside deaminase [Saprospiraceae bacterium]